MHIFFSGIGGTGIGPLALIARAAGYDVSGSDKQDSQYIEYLKKHGITDIHIGQGEADIAKIHANKTIDWFVHTSALTLESSDPPELKFCKDNGIRVSKRDELLNHIIEEKRLKLIAVAGTHGKTTTTAMFVWLFKQLGIPVSYSVGAKISFGEMGEYDPKSEYFVYEADEFDRNFLAFRPFVSIITGVSYDHHEIFPTQDDYNQAFRDFIGQSEWLEIWREDKDRLGLPENDHHAVMDSHDPGIDQLKLAGRYNRLDAWLAVKAVRQLSQKPLEEIISYVQKFPGLTRRMEEIAPGLYSDYAHTPEKIRGAMSAALELCERLDLSQTAAADRLGSSGKSVVRGLTSHKKVIVVYEPLTNRRQHYMIDDYKDCFAGAEHVYWVPSYLAREDPEQRIIPPAELIEHLSDPSIAEPAELNDELKQAVQNHLTAGDMVVAMAGGGGGSLDDWIRREFVH